MTIDKSLIGKWIDDRLNQLEAERIKKVTENSDVVKSASKERKWTIDRLIELSGISRATIFRIRNNKKAKLPSRNTVNKLEKVLGDYEPNQKSIFGIKVLDSYLTSFGSCDFCYAGMYIPVRNYMDNYVEVGPVKLNVLIVSTHRNKKGGYTKRRQLLGPGGAYKDKVCNGAIKYEVCDNCLANDLVNVFAMNYSDLLKNILNNERYNQRILSSELRIEQSRVSRLIKEEVEYLQPGIADKIHKIALKLPNNTIKKMVSLDDQNLRPFFLMLKFNLYQMKHLSFDRKEIISDLGHLKHIGKQNIKIDLAVNAMHGRIACFRITKYSIHERNKFLAYVTLIKGIYSEVCLLPDDLDSLPEPEKGYICFRRTSLEETDFPGYYRHGTPIVRKQAKAQSDINV